MTRWYSQLILCISILSCYSSSIHATEKEFMALFENGEADDYETLAHSFSEGEAPSQETLMRNWSDKLKNRGSIIPHFVLIREILRHNHGVEVMKNLSVASPKRLLGVLLSFKNPISVTLFSDELFKRDPEKDGLPAIIAGKERIMTITKKLETGFESETSPRCPDHLKPPVILP